MTSLQELQRYATLQRMRANPSQYHELSRKAQELWWAELPDSKRKEITDKCREEGTVMGVPEQ